MRISFDIWGTKPFSNGLEALCIRQLVNAAENAASTAKDTAAGLGATAAGEQSTLQPFYKGEMTAEHLFDPSQTNEMLTAAGAGLGAGAGAADAEMQRNAAATGNGAGIVKGEQQLARDRMKNAAGVSEGIASQDVMGAKQLNQAGAAGMSGLYGENLKGQLDAMGQQSADINAATNASNSGWLQNAEGVAKTAAGIAAPFAAGCWIAAAVYGGWDSPRVPIVREYIFNTWPKQSWVGRLVAKLYMRFGERVAKVVKVSPTLKSVFLSLFERIQ